MARNRIIHMIAGTFIMLSTYLYGVSNSLNIFTELSWLCFTFFVGANLFQSGITNWCLMEKILKTLNIGK